MRQFSADTADENVITIDTDSAPRILFYGEDFLCEDLPVGTRVVYPRRPISGLPNPAPPFATPCTTPRRWSRCTRCCFRG